MHMMKNPTMVCSRTRCCTYFARRESRSDELSWPRRYWREKHRGPARCLAPNRPRRLAQVWLTLEPPERRDCHLARVEALDSRLILFECARRSQPIESGKCDYDKRVREQERFWLCRVASRNRCLFGFSGVAWVRPRKPNNLLDARAGTHALSSGGGQ
jgi:hypothetical protein